MGRHTMYAIYAYIRVVWGVNVGMAYMECLGWEDTHMEPEKGSYCPVLSLRTVGIRRTLGKPTHPVATTCSSVHHVRRGTGREQPAWGVTSVNPSGFSTPKPATEARKGSSFQPPKTNDTITVSFS